MCGPVAQWIRHLTTNQEIPGSNPGGVDSFLNIREKRLNIRFNKRSTIVK